MFELEEELARVRAEFEEQKQAILASKALLQHRRVRAPAERKGRSCSCGVPPALTTGTVHASNTALLYLLTTALRYQLSRSLLVLHRLRALLAFCKFGTTDAPARPNSAPGSDEAYAFRIFERLFSILTFFALCLVILCTPAMCFGRTMTPSSWIRVYRPTAVATGPTLALKWIHHGMHVT